MYSALEVMKFIINVTKGEWRHLHATSFSRNMHIKVTHKIRRKIKTKYVDNKNKMKKQRKIENSVYKK